MKYKNSISFQAYQGSDPEYDAKNILSTKFSAWKHEKEVRVFTDQKFVKITLHKVYFGCEMPEQQRTLVSDLITRIAPNVEIIQMQRKDLDTQNL